MLLTFLNLFYLNQYFFALFNQFFRHKLGWGIVGTCWGSVRIVWGVWGQDGEYVCRDVFSLLGGPLPARGLVAAYFLSDANVG